MHQSYLASVYINVEQNLQKAFKQSSYLPTNHLSNDIWIAIEHKNNQAAKRKTLGYFSLGFLSLLGSIFSIKFLIEQFIRLGFFDYLALAFSDGSVMATYWREYTGTLVDSLPTANLGLSLVLMLVLFISIKKGVFYQSKRQVLLA